jgi:hypothetical protein
MLRTLSGIGNIEYVAFNSSKTSLVGISELAFLFIPEYDVRIFQGSNLH